MWLLTRMAVCKCNQLNGFDVMSYSSYGFKLPASQIEGVGEEIWAAMPIVAETAAKEGLGRDVSFEAEQARNAAEKRSTM